MKIKAFGPISEIVSADFDVDTPLVLADFRQALHKQFPKLVNLDYQIAVNQSLVRDENYTIDAADEIALLPPFSGG